MLTNWGWYLSVWRCTLRRHFCDRRMHVRLGSSGFQLCVRANEQNAVCGCHSVSCTCSPIYSTESRLVMWPLSAAECIMHSSKVRLKLKAVHNRAILAKICTCTGWKKTHCCTFPSLRTGCRRAHTRTQQCTLNSTYQHFSEVPGYTVSRLALLIDSRKLSARKMSHCLYIDTESRRSVSYTC